MNLNEIPSDETLTVEELLFFPGSFTKGENGLMTKNWSNGAGRFEIEGSVVRSYEFVGEEIDGWLVMNDERLVDTFELVKK